MSDGGATVVVEGLKMAAQVRVGRIMLWLVSNSRALVDPTLWLDGQRLLFLMACAAAWFGTINAVREIVKEAPIFQREYRVGIGPVGALTGMLGSAPIAVAAIG